MSLAASDLLAGCKLAPYWWDDVPRPAIADAPLPPRVDVAVIGAGYTGLHAALQTARGQRSTLVLDAEEAGWGCSTRNGGQVSTSIKPDFDRLARRHGPTRAFEILREGQRSLAFIAEFIREEGIACDFDRVGRFHAAHNAAQYEALATRVGRQVRGLEIEAHMVPRAEQRSELGTDAYWGGAVYAQHCSVHPARYHQGLLERALAAGAQVAPRTPVTRIERQADGFLVQTARGAVRARDVVVATNGYTGAVTPWLQRRVIPIGSYMIATEELAPGLMDRLIPRNRIVSDTRKVVYYYRASPGPHGASCSAAACPTRRPTRAPADPALHADMVAVFPELAGTRISHSWCGFVAYTFDELMHVGGTRACTTRWAIAARVSAPRATSACASASRCWDAEGRTALDGGAFQTRPFYTGNPWFLAPSIRYYRWKDRRG